jgi:alpha-2-macroglobulin
MKTLRLVLFITALLAVASCKKSREDFDSDFSLYKDYITSFSSGIISSTADIQVGLAFAKKDWKVNDELDNSYFSVSPSVSGKVVFLPDNIIAFRPAERLDQDKEYLVTLHLTKFVEVPAKLADFNFTIKTLKQDFTVETLDLQSYTKDTQYINAVLKSSDVLDAAIAKKLVKAEQDGKQLPIRFESTTAGVEHRFIIDSIRRRDSDSMVMVTWDGSNEDIDAKGEYQFTIPGKDNFKVVSITPIDGNNQEMHINFSDPIRKDQDLSGLVAVKGVENLKYAVEGNLLKVYFSEPLNGTFFTEVFQGIENIDGYKTKKTFSAQVVFEQLPPEVKFLKSGTILPASSNLKLNFQAVNLSKVDVKVFRIFENNVMQFLQDNELDGSYDLRKVARPIAKKTLMLNTDKLTNYAKWNTFAIDLSTLIKPQQGAIYRVELTMKPSYSIYKCDKKLEDNEEKEEDEESQIDEDEYYDYYDYDYDWNQRDNPCNKSFYYNKKVAANVLASDIGVISKRGENNNYFFAVNSITTTEPIAGANIEIYSFQQQKMASFATGAEGTVSITLSKPGFFAIVKKDNNTTYIKLADGNSKSLSNFDVDGAKLQKGLKGYIYGERGVWRPGDTLFLGFILNDKAGKLPDTHPIKLRINDPNGKLMYQATQTYNKKNHFKFVVPTQAGAATGTWEAMIAVGGAKFYKALKIETIKPNRLRIKNGLEGKMISAAVQTNANVNVSWLHGAIAKDLKIEMQAKLLKQETKFKGYLNYVFDDPAREFSSEEINIFSGKTDAAGNVAVGIQPKMQSAAPGMLKAAIITKAYEKGGDFSTDVVTATYSPYDTYVGVKAPQGNKYNMLETGKPHKFDIATVDEYGKPKHMRQLEVKVFKVEWRWWWDASNDDVSSFSYAITNSPMLTQRIWTDANGKAAFIFTPDKEEWGRYLVRVTDVEGGHSAGQTVLADYSEWSGMSRQNGGREAAMLMFTTDKEKYAVGEKAIIAFPSSAGGRALISLENGSGIVQTIWAKTTAGETKAEIPITGKMAPNVYIHISLLQPHANTENDSPIRLYGIVPIEVVDKNTILQPVIKMPEVLKPEQQTTIRVSEKSGKPMTYTIAIVDDGLLDLTRFKTPNAWNDFYAKEALGVKTWDVYDDVIGAYGGKVNQIFSIGGDEDLGGGSAKKANRFKPVVMYMGPYTIGKSQTGVHNIKLPKYVGSVRTMVVAANTDITAYGNAEKTTPVRSPLMLLASLPRKVTPKERVTLPVTVFAMENQIKNVTLSVKTNSGLKVIGASSQTINFARPDEKIVYFDLDVADFIGIGRVTLTAQSGKEKASYAVELDVMNPNPVTINYKEMVINAGQSASMNWLPFGVAGSNRARLEVSSFPSIDFNRRLDYLIQYPHGCLEQVTSSAFPQLYLADVADIDQNRRQKIQKNVNVAIQKLSGYQIASGAFAYWPGSLNPDDWGSSYVGHFFIEAEKKGYALPGNAKKQWLAYQSKTAKQWRYNEGYRNDFAQAYRLYTLALAGAPDLSSMNRLKETPGISNESRLRLAAAYALAGQKNTGLALLNRSSMDVDNSPYRYDYYGSPERNRAMALETLVILGQKEQAFKTAIKLAKEMSSGEWMSTQTTAFCLYAMSKFAKANGSKGIDVTYTSNGKTSVIKTVKGFADRELPVTGKTSAAIKNDSGGALYVKVVYSGIFPVGHEQEEYRGLATVITFKDRHGKIINPSSLKQGTEFVAEVTINNMKNEKVDNVALTQIVPSGWEIVNTRFTDFGAFAENKVDYTDIRDDRTNYYFSLRANESKTFRILLNASYPGSYYLPGIQAEAMYDNSFLARTKGQWVKVVK